MNTPTLPIAYLRHLLEVADSHGVDTSKILGIVGIDRATLQDERSRIPLARDFNLISRIQEIARIPCLGLQVGAKFQVSDLGILGHAIMCSANVGSAIDVYQRYHQLVDPEIQVDLETTDGKVDVVVDERVPLGSHYRYYIEATLSGWLSLRSLFSTSVRRFVSLTVTWDEPRRAELYAELFGCPIHFGARRNALTFPADWLDEKLTLANREVAALCAKHCQDQLQAFSQGIDIVDAVREELVHSPGKFPEFTEVAARLGLSARTLRRRLTEAGTSFRDVLIGVRMEIAATYLRNTHLSTQEVAYRVGYSEPANFHRAFKQRFSMTPGDYRLGEGALQAPGAMTPAGDSPPN